MLKHPYASEPITSITIDLRSKDVAFLKSSLANRGDKLCLVTHVTNLINELRKHLDAHPGDLADAGTIAQRIVNRFAFGFAITSASKEESAHVSDDRRSYQPRNRATHPSHEPTEPPRESRQRRGEVKPQASKEADKTATKRGRRSNGGD